MNPTEWNAKGYTGFFWGGTAFCVFVWAFFRLPETKGRTYEELDVLFAKGVSARKFKSTNVDTFNETENRKLSVAVAERRASSVGFRRGSLMGSRRNSAAGH